MAKGMNLIRWCTTMRPVVDQRTARDFVRAVRDVRPVRAVRPIGVS